MFCFGYFGLLFFFCDNLTTVLSLPTFRVLGNAKYRWSTLCHESPACRLTVTRPSACWVTARRLQGSWGSRADSGAWALCCSSTVGLVPLLLMRGTVFCQSFTVFLSMSFYYSEPQRRPSLVHCFIVSYCVCVWIVVCVELLLPLCRMLQKASVLASVEACGLLVISACELSRRHSQTASS